MASRGELVRGEKNGGLIAKLQRKFFIVKYKVIYLLFASAFIAAFSFCFELNTRAQSGNSPAGVPKPVPKAVDENEPPTVVVKAPPKPLPTPLVQIPENPRERRALAYTKLLEGQRYMLTLRRGVSQGSMVAILNAAKNSFQTAVILEPTLAEAYTALTELTLLFPPQDLDEAIRYGNKAISIDKNNYGGHRLLSLIYLVKSEYAKNQLDQTNTGLAIRELKEVVRLDKTDGEAWAILSELYQFQKREDEMIEALKNWADSTENVNVGFYQYVTPGKQFSNDVAFSRLAQIYLAKGKTKEAIEYITRAISLNPDDENYIDILVAGLEASGGEDGLSITEVKKIVANYPSNLRLVRLLAETQVRAGLFDDAIITLRGAILRLSDDDESNEALTLQLALAETYEDALREKDAIAVYENILLKRSILTKAKLDEEEKMTASIVLSGIIALQKNLGNFKEAEIAIERMRKVLGPDDTQADSEAIDLLLNQGKRNEALVAVKAMRQNNPRLISLVVKEAEILTELNRIDEAASLIRSKLSNSGNSSGQDVEIDRQLYLILSGFYSQAKRGKEAVEAAQKGLALVPKDNRRLLHAALTTLASAQETAGDFNSAESTLRKILAGSPNDATALNNLGYFLVDRNERVQEGFGMVQRAVKTEPANSSFLDSLGWAYFRLGKFTEAERYLSEAARRNPFSATIQDHLGDVYQKLGKTDSARIAWNQALKFATDKDEQTKLKAKLNAKSIGAKQ